MRDVLVARRGFTLIEVLVALLVVALGLGGALAMHLRAQRAAFEAARMSDGVQVATALAERMRANRAVMALPDAANPYLHFDYDAAAGPPAPTAEACYDAACTPDALARFDLDEIGARVAAGFPGGRIVCCRDGSGPDASGVPSWACDGAADAPVVIKLGWHSGGKPAAPAVVLMAEAS
jgi:type IV pilus assembly protein PilV